MKSPYYYKACPFAYSLKAVNRFTNKLNDLWIDFAECGRYPQSMISFLEYSLNLPPGIAVWKLVPSVAVGLGIASPELTEQWKRARAKFASNKYCEGACKVLF